MKIEYDFQMDEIKNDERFNYDDEVGQYIYDGDFISITINVWNRKINVYLKYEDMDIGTNDLSVLKYILQMCNYPKDVE